MSKNKIPKIIKINNTLYCESNNYNMESCASSQFLANSKIKNLNVEVCGICLGNFTAIPNSNDDSTIILKCGHTFHKKCINTWFLKSGKSIPECPLCRKAFTNQNILEGKINFKNNLKNNSKNNSKKIINLEGHNLPVSSVAISPDSKFILSGSYDKTLRIWDANSGNCIKILKGPTKKILSVAWSTNQPFIACGSEDNNVHWWGIAPNLFKSSTLNSLIYLLTYQGKFVNYQRLKGHIGPVLTVAFAPDGLTIVSGSVDNCIRIWNPLKSDDSIGIIEPNRGNVLSVEYNRDGSLLISSHGDQSICIWNSVTKHSVYIIENSGYVYSIKKNPYNKYFATCSSNGTVCIWELDLVSTELIKKYTIPGNIIEGCNNKIVSLTWSPNGKSVLYCSMNGTISIATIGGSLAQSPDSVRNNQSVYTKIISYTPNINILSVSWSPNGDFIVACDSNSKVIKILGPFFTHRIYRKINGVLGKLLTPPEIGSMNIISGEKK